MERVAQLIAFRRKWGLEEKNTDKVYDEEYDDYLKGFTNSENSEDNELVNELINWNEETKDHKDFKKQSFPRFNPMVKQDNIDTRAEIRETIDSVIEPLKADKKEQTDNRKKRKHASDSPADSVYDKGSQGFVYIGPNQHFFQPQHPPVDSVCKHFFKKASRSAEGQVKHRRHNRKKTQGFFVYFSDISFLQNIHIESYV